MELSLRCACGQLRGEARGLRPDGVNRLVCMCEDCQAYAHHLGRADEVLDAHGGTEVFQITPSQIVLTEGTEHLRCLRLTPKGLVRWYAGCCKTPVANTVAWARMPFAGVVHAFIDPEVKGSTTEQVLGPILALTQARYAVGDPPTGAYQSAPFSLIVRTLRFFARGMVKGAHQPSPFFDSESGQPVVEPTVLSEQERESLRRIRAGGTVRYAASP